MYLAYKNGRIAVDPSEGWYEGELRFFDNYVIPLARKLETCSVVGGSSDEFLQYAITNRNEWEVRGQDLVKSMVQEVGSNNCEANDYGASMRAGFDGEF
jgi:hypothetical protein